MNAHEDISRDRIVEEIAAIVGAAHVVTDDFAMQPYLVEERGLYRAIEEIYRYPLRPTATDTINRQLKAGISDEQLADLVMDLRAEDRLCVVSDGAEAEGVRIVCSLGMV